MVDLAFVLARAGGGEGFGGFGGGGGGGGGTVFRGGGGGGFGFPLFFFGGGGLAAGGSIVVLLLIVGAVVAVGLGAARRRSQPLEPPLDDEGLTGLPAWPPGPEEAAARTAAGEAGSPRAGLEAITAHDPAFSESAFLSAAERAFFLVQKAWTEQRPELSRQVMADGVWLQHRDQIESQKATGTRNVLEGLAVASAAVRSASSDQSFDFVTVRFVAGCADYYVDSEGRFVRGDRQMRQWSEDWIFQRSSSATTRTDGGTLGSHCPNCGAPLDLDEAGTCSYCRALVMSGAYDWVLSRIEQVPGTVGIGG